MSICTIDGCNREQWARGLCHMHYQRWWRHGDANHVGRRTHPVIVCSVNDCDARAKARGLCDMHYQRWQKHGDPNRVDPPAPLPVMRGADNLRWKGDDALYTAIHHRLYRFRGPAADQQCPCGEPAKDWAYDRSDPNELIDAKSGFPYSTDPARYVALCRVCHRRLDRTGVVAS